MPDLLHAPDLITFQLNVKQRAVHWKWINRPKITNARNKGKNARNRPSEDFENFE